ncbi:unnamed protein product [Urochloa decumbens]|uniref:Receptor kinase-like protein Xa21 n=1 Tax=Urochloa decumbens TaxID=240449 RepID=A0ABC9C463_9POAL
MKIGAMSLAVSSLVSVLMIAAASDTAALLAFKAGLSSGALASWNSSARFCSWEGVTCSRRTPTRVVALSLPSRNLAGTLSPAIGNLTFLRALNLSSNGLYGEIPPSVGRLRRLRVLDLGRNSMSGALPANLSSCISLTYLRLQYNQIDGCIPAELGNTLTRLEGLVLRNNSITGPIPASLANLSSLRYLVLDDNHLGGLIPSGIGNIAGLQRLDLDQNSLSGVFPPSLWNLSSLTVLQVNYNMLHGSIPPNIGGKFPSMLVFAVNNNWFSGAIPSSLSNLSALIILDLSENNFTGLVPSTLGRLHSVVHLYLGENQLEADDRKGWQFINSLANCSQIQGLTLSDNYFSGQLPRSIVNLSTTLEELYLHNNRISGSIPEDIGNMIGLALLSLGLNSISGVIPESIGKLAYLATLDLHNTGLSGLIPSSIGNLSNLNLLSAYNTNLGGPIPPSLGNLKKLFVLDLSHNHLNGSIPKEILDLPSLSWYMDLSNNFLSGPLPAEVGVLANLNSLHLSGNQLSGQIPDSIGNCEVLEFLFLDMNSFEGGIPQTLAKLKGLNILNLTMNRLSGRIPDTLGTIGNLQQLSLTHNNFSGPIPATLQNLKYLWNLNVSFNNLEGKVPDEGVFRNLTYTSVEGNDKLCGGIPSLRLEPCTIVAVSVNKKGWPKLLRIALPTIGGTLLFVSAIVLTLVWHRKLKQRENRRATSQAIDEQHQRISYYALSSGTNGFSEANLLGKGRYGYVYRCTLEHDGSIMAVKVFNLQQSGSLRSFDAECEALRRVRHRCLLKIITCCSSIDQQGEEFKALVFEFMPNGSLDGWINPQSSNPTSENTLSLSQRLCIAVDILDALDYLHNHSQPPIIHCDLKPSNILLAEDKSAKVGDFGISRILPPISTTKSVQNSESSVRIRGSIGYIPPEYGEGSAASRLGDVYSFGILLLEMFTGRSPTDDMFKDSLDLHKFAATAVPDRALDIADQTIWLHEEADDNTDFTDARITRGIIQRCLLSVLRLGVSCSKQLPRERMSLADAVQEMHSIRERYLRSRSRT